MNINLTVNQTEMKEIQEEFDLETNRLNGENVLILHASRSDNIIYHIK